MSANIGKDIFGNTVMKFSMKNNNTDHSNLKPLRYEIAFNEIGIKMNDYVRKFTVELHKEGYTEKSVCCVIYKKKSLILSFRKDHTFWGALRNTIRKYGFLNADGVRKKIKKEKEEEAKRIARIEEAKRKANENAKTKRNRILSYFIADKWKGLGLTFEHNRTEKRFYDGLRNCNLIHNYIYFIQADNGAIKIGITTDIKNRFNGLRTSSPYQLTLLTYYHGNWYVEQALHEKFKDSRLQGEWFEPTEELLVLIEEVKGWNKGEGSHAHAR